MRFGFIMLGEWFDQDGLLGQLGPDASETSNLNPFFRLENRKPMVSEGETACPSHDLGPIISSRATELAPFPPSFPITRVCQCPAVTSGRETTVGKVEAGKVWVQRGADARSGMDPGLTNLLLLGTERPVLFLEARSTQGRGVVDSCHASGIIYCPVDRCSMHVV